MMTWANQFLIYAGIGAIVAIATLRTFPPMEGFQPKLYVRMFAGLVFALLWPFLVLLAAWYLMVGYITRFRQQRSELQDSSLELSGHAIQQQIVKPR